MAKRLTDIDPDGVRIEIDWDELRVGGSVFIPCINYGLAVSQLERIARMLGVRLTFRRKVEGEMLGLRIWRTA